MTTHLLVAAVVVAAGAALVVVLRGVRVRVEVLQHVKVDSPFSLFSRADYNPRTKSPPLKQVVLGGILTNLASIWRVGSS